MLGVCDIAHFPVPACTAGQALVALTGSRAGMIVFVNDATGPGPARNWWLVDHMA